jgi:uncharacterized damage-inducible protein DinB
MTGRRGVPSAASTDAASLIAAWRTNHLATVFLVERLPLELWESRVPGLPHRTVGSVAAHLHNSRCGWIKSLGAAHGVTVPRRVDARKVEPPALVEALARSCQGIVDLIELGAARGGRVPRATWQNFPTDLHHFLTYFAAHEGHHRGQLLAIARQLGCPLPDEVRHGVWQWVRLAREGAAARRKRGPAGRVSARRGSGTRPRRGARASG